MDSLTQIVLGAACGEAVLGKKIGNKALLFGAIGGTIPDLDVYVGSLLYGNEIDAMLFHRGFMHSILFSIVAAFLLGWAFYKLYNTGKRLYQTTQRDWVLLFFWSLFTHPILDCFTPYGTQLFSPFSNYRVAFNNIAVVDVFYTLPFLICLIVVMCYKRQHVKRRLWLKRGIIISSVYMLLTVANKFYIDSIFKTSVPEDKWHYSRHFLQPSLFSNFLWYGIAESKEAYIIGYYSLFDAKKKFSNLKEHPKQLDLSSEQYNDIEQLAWFSNHYYTIYKMDDNTYKYNDMRYPLMDNNDPNSAVFSFMLYKDDNRLNMKPFERKAVNFSEVISVIWQRVKGI